MKKTLIWGGAIIGLVIILVLGINFINKPEVSKNTTTVVNKVVKKGSGWYVNDEFLDKSFKHFGSSKPEMGDNIDLELDDKGRVVGWEVKDE